MVAVLLLSTSLKTCCCESFIRLEENIAEKVSRLNRTTTARDLYDLGWQATHQRDVGALDTDLIRRLVVLKIWVDAHGVSSAHARGGQDMSHGPSTPRTGCAPKTQQRLTSTTSGR